MTFAANGIGISTSHSIAIGEAHLLQRGPLHISPRWVGNQQIEEEVLRFRQAVSDAAGELRAVREQLPATTAPDIAEFIDAHLLMMEDHALTGAPEEIIRQEGCAAEWALQIRRNALVKLFDQMTDPYLRTRKDDLDHVVHRIQKRLLHIDNRTDETQVHGKIILAKDLSPADTILMRHQGVIAFITEFGSPMSHTAILARSLNIPAVVGVRHITEYVRQGEALIVDGEHGVVIASPESAIRQQFVQRLEQEQTRTGQLRKLADAPAVSQDGQRFQLMANIELSDDIESALVNGATAVGLYRTEFLYMNRSMPPSEEEHYCTYREVLDGLDGMPITIRTLDLGADKQVDSQAANIPAACNPALGLRAIRLCLKETELFKTQLRAILRVSAHGSVRLMLPMLTNVREVQQALVLLQETREELLERGQPFDAQMPVGGMIEVPGAALTADSFAELLDFLSIGTNDLIQYTLAIDRIDDEVNYLYDPLHPAVLRLIKMTIDAANRAGIPVSMCGEMAGDPQYVRLLGALGLRDFSMQPNALPRIKQAVLLSNIGELQAKANRMLDHLHTAEGQQLLSELLRANY